MAVALKVKQLIYGLSTQVPVGVDEGSRHDSSIHCDELVSLPKSMLTHFVGSLPAHRMAELDRAMVVALGVNMNVLGAGDGE
jgi:mRNA interferase MazF